MIVNGYKMQVDKNDSLGLKSGAFESAETSLVKKRIKPGQVVFDIGANIGYYTLLFSGLVGPSGKVFAFEPDPVNFSILEENVKENGCANVELICGAVSNKSEQTKLYLCKENSGDHRAYDSHDGRDSVEVKSICLNELPIKRPDFVKIDVQGFEFFAVSGMSLLLGSFSVEILTEFWPFGLTNAGSSAEEYFLLLKRLGFRVYSVSMEEIIKIEQLSHYTVKSQSFTNLFCVK